MRISTAHQFETYRARISARQADLFAAQQQMLTGKSFSKASENPAATRQVVSANNLIGRAEQIGKNLITAKKRLSYNETALSEMTTLTNRARTLVIQGANDTNTPEAREALATELETLRDQIVNIGNTRDSRGRYIFSGQQVDTKAFSAGTGTLIYNGDGLPLQAEIAPGERMNVALENPEGLIRGLYDRLNSAINNMRSGNGQTLSDQDLAGLEQIGKSVNLVRGTTGAQIARVEKLNEQNELRIDDLKTQVSDLQDIDIAEAITRYQQAETAYSAALQTVAKGYQLSLMDFLR